VPAVQRKTASGSCQRHHATAMESRLLESHTFVIHQIGAGSDGGLTSIGEIIARTPIGRVRVITNISSDFTRRWEKSASVITWPMSEGGYGAGRKLIGRVFHRLANNVRAFLEVRRNGSKVVHLNDHCAFWNAAFGAKLAGARLIMNVRDGMREGASASRWRFYLRMSDRFLVLSRDMEDHWRERLAPLPARDAGKFCHLYSIVDQTRFHPVGPEDRQALRERLGIDHSRRALIYVGRFDDKKAQLAFIQESLPAIVRACPNVMLHFIGDFRPEQDAYAAACRTAVADLGLGGHVRFVGYASEMADWYRAADLILLASMREGLARCMIEGIVCGTPMVSFDVCSAREILEERHCGSVVPLRDYPAFARAVITLLADDELRGAKAKRGLEVADMFAPDRNAAAYAELVREVAG
jgi:glycosyltransferase involved in cell wall biosynthesis